MLQEFIDVDRAILTAQEAIWDAGAFDVLTSILGRVANICIVGLPTTCVQGAVERFLVVNPKLEIAGLLIGIA